MGDMTIHYVPVCATNLAWQLEVTGSKGDTYIVRWERDWRPDAPAQYHYTCTCKSGQFRPDEWCRHIKEADPQRCKWNATMDIVGLTGPARVCPRCGSSIETVKVAV